MPFITVEGIDGTGKTTLLQRLNTAIRAFGHHCYVTREPGGTVFAEHARQLFLASPNLSNLTQLLLVSAARVDHIERVIAPRLHNGEFVLCSRFTDSTRAYQCVAPADGMAEHTLRALTAVDASPLALEPDLTFLLDAPVAVCLARMERGEDSRDVIQERDVQFFDALRRAFLRLPSRYPGRMVVVDAGRSEAAVFADCFDQLTTKFNVG